MEEQTAKQILNQAGGWIDWNDIASRPNWVGGKIVLDGRFSADELRAIIEFERKGQ
jgi:hypothetical protein